MHLALLAKEVKKLFSSIHSNPGIKQLSVNPLLLTILTLIQSQGGRLPDHRVELFDLCVTTLLHTWVTSKGLVGDTPFSKNELFKMLRPLSLWMHEHRVAGAVPEEELLEQIAKLLLECCMVSNEKEAIRIAEQFLHIIRGKTGILVERGKKRYGFLHRTFEEYLAARELVVRKDCAEFIQAHLHNPQWKEVILLLLDYVGIIESDEERVTDLLRDGVFHAQNSYEKWLHRNLLFAGRCLADDAGVHRAFEQEVIEQIIHLYLTSPFASLRRPILNVFLERVSDSQLIVRVAVMRALGRLGIDTIQGFEVLCFC